MKKTILYSLGALLLTGNASALTVFWGSNVWSDIYESDGSTMVSAADFTFQIGAFDAGFDPETAAVEDFSNAWHVFDESDYSDTNMFFDSKADMGAGGISNGTNADTSFDFRSSELYIWVYNANAPATDGTTELCHEWALIEGGWVLPASEGDQTTLPEEYRVSNAVSPIYGGLNNVQNPDAVAGVDYTAPSGAFDLQTHTVCLQAVPEPSSSLLLLLSSLGFLARRNRK